MQKRDDEILRLTDRFRLGTNLAYRQVLFAEHSLNAVTKVTARLCQQSWLRRYPLIPPEDYFTLGPAAVRNLGYANRRSEPLGSQSLPIDYAVLLYGTHGQRTRLMKAELSESLPWLPDELTHAPYCRSGSGVLELIRVDLGGSPQHVAKKAAADCSARWEIDEFRKLVEQQRFQMVILTTTPSKARLIRQAVEAVSWNDSIRLHLAIIPRLTLLQLRQQ
ncbi:MAG: hypothetical protein IAG10_27220 [Planctomycetaceae bacterium]|nr:hypothetical protein [Planctomycetaceae bacterium]